MFDRLHKFARGGMVVYFFDKQKELRIYALPLNRQLIDFFQRIRKLKGNRQDEINVQDTIKEAQGIMQKKRSGKKSSGL